MDWRHIKEVTTAGENVFGPLKNLITWVKPNAGMGSFYRSQHELIFVYLRVRETNQQFWPWRKWPTSN